MAMHSAGSKYVERGAAVADTAAAVPDSAVESILQVKQIEEEFVSQIRMDPDQKYVEGEVVVVVAAAGCAAAAAAVPEPALGPIPLVVVLLDGRNC